jgi:hypothetical protein
VPTPTASKSESGEKGKRRSRKRRTDTVLVFDRAQKVRDHVLKSIIDEWLVPCLVEEFSAKSRTAMVRGVGLEPQLIKEYSDPNFGLLPQKAG